VGSIPVQSYLDGSGVKAMTGSISAPNFGSLEKIRKIQVAKWGTPKKKIIRYVLFACTRCSLAYLTGINTR